MAVYAIGDIQGCYDPLRRLLDLLRFDPTADMLWLVGDLVNRGPHSVEVLRLVHGLGERAVAVLGNHDLTLLAVAAGQVKPKRKDTFHSILDAPDRDELLDWLRRCPLLHHDAELGFTLVHAGLPPQWDLALAQRCAAELAATLRGPDYQRFLAHMFGSEPRRWRDDLSGYDRLRFTVNALTRMRFCTADGALSFAEKGSPGSQGLGLLPWFAVPGRRNADLNLVFGHWAALGYYRVPGIYALDSGCVWGNRLTAIRLDEPGVPAWSVPAHNPVGADMTAPLTLIAALARNRVIGRDNRLPWHLPADLRFFKQTTMGKPLLMGRRTWESIGRPLPGRRMIVLSRDPAYRPSGCTVARSLDDALEMVGAAAEPMVIGGAMLYRQTLPRAERLYLTLVEADLPGDAWFPEWDMRDWRLVWEEAHPADTKHVWPYRFQRWERIRGLNGS